MVFHNSHLPLYRQVEDTLRKKIASGGLKEGDLLPSEQALAKEYGVSQGTVRKAVLDLTQKGILYRKQGKGTFVVFQRHNLGRYRNFRFVEELGSDLVGINISFLNLKVVSAHAEIARNLQVRQGTKLIRLERLGKIADQFLFHTASYYQNAFTRAWKNLERRSSSKTPCGNYRTFISV